MVTGTSGNDSFFSYTPGEYIDGGAGTDMAHLHRENTSVFLFLDISNDAIINGGQTLNDGTYLINVERVSFYAGSGGSFVRGSSTLNGSYFGGAGFDTFYGGAVQDRFSKIGTLDVVHAGGGDDFIEVIGVSGGPAAAPGLIDGGTGTDTLRILGPAAFGLGSIESVEKIQVVDGTMSFNNQGQGDLVSFNGLFDYLTSGVGVTVTTTALTPAGATAGTGPLGVNILGSAYDDNITGGAGNDILSGGRGNDILRGGAGNDILNGGTGLDQLFGDAGNDTLLSKNPDGLDAKLDGGADFDFAWIERTHQTAGYTIDVSDPNVTATDSLGMKVVNIEKFIIEGGSGADNITTGAGDDKLYGNAGGDTLTAGGGTDWLNGGAGDDILDGGAGTDFAMYSGSFASYTIVHNLDGTITITDNRVGSPDGTDTLSNIEYATFDGFDPGNPAHDHLL